ncbi:uncharacterized protein I303_101039 [Kwoniella dejecticola CBS 10117]|uniref:GDP/GTP exchange factor Sec2 N-terminal domain-containing protein n=1 Tax=Kwoniella dejecticola CBS 10117 TaxID=1296121 RepID=A0A1A6AGM6_9TREE|nr:uncharacterized protein I303_01041 [Kwoniella dejecticola CBS 10117]OBR89216.1 hypothetical protein I303_01041 [Kwoniella dejecticola CBS 10117]
MMHAGGGVPSMAYYSYSNQNSPVIETANNDNPFDLASMTIPPRLKSIGRKISQMSNDFMPPDIEDPNNRSKANSPVLDKKQPLGADVPGMGDEPIMCPFCNKPLPPSLLAAQTVSHKHDHSNTAQRPNNLRRASSMRVTSTPSPKLTPSAPLSRVPSANTPPQTHKPSPLLDPLPLQTPGSKAVETEPPIPSATSETFAATVKEGDVANHDAAEKMITEEDIKRWSTLSGITLPATTPGSSAPVPSAPESSATAAKSPAEEKKAFPLLPPPPPAASKLTKPPPADRASSSSKFGFFGGNKNKEKGEDDSDDDDDMAQGYTQLTGPASDSEDEESAKKRVIKEDPPKVEKEPENEAQNAEVDAKEEQKDVSISQPNYAEQQDRRQINLSSNDVEVRKVLQEVLGRVNELSKSQTALLASHSTLLTSLKIARSNLAMAEANSEMLEEQLKRASTSSVASRAGNSRNVSGPATTPGTPQLAAPAPIRASADHVRATTTANAVASPVAAARVPARASMEERTRPTSLHITANDLANAGPGGLIAPSPSSSSNSWGFWNGGKKKVTGALSHVHVPSASSMMDVLGNPSRPGTPNPDGSAPRKSTESQSGRIPTSPAIPSSVPIASNAPSRPPANRTVTHQANLSKSFNDQPSLSRSMSVMNVPAQRSASGSAAATSVSNAELSKLRQAYSAAVAKMDGMSKELAELKKGKVEMEAELENLSQALFEEANKMVADERRKRAELEESFKEVKEEREALRETIKVLGGKVEEPSSAEEPEDAQAVESKKEEDDVELEADFVPRDLDKHYAALRKSIHHVASHSDTSEDDDGDDDEDKTTRIPLVSEPGSITPSMATAPFAIPSTRTSTMNSEDLSDDNDNTRMLSMSMPSLPAAAENNPWATPLVSSMTPFETPAPRINVKAATPSPYIPSAGLPDLPDDRAGEGEAASGLGLEVDTGVTAGEAGRKEGE